MSVATTSQVDWATVDLAEQRFHLPLAGEPGSQPWLDQRARFANASTAAVHVREHEYESIAEWAARKITGEQVKETPKMKAGKMLEPALRVWYAQESGLVWTVPTIAYGVGRLLANPDGVTPGPFPGSCAGLEIKSTEGARSRKSRYWQCVAGLVTTGWEEWHLVEYWHEYGQLQVMRIEWDAEVEADARRLLAAVDADWDWVDIGMIPEDAEITDDVAKMLTRQATSERTEVPADAETLVLSRQRLDASIKAATKERDEINGALRMMFGGATAAWLPDGRKLGTYKVVNGSTLDREALERDHPGLLAEYTRPNPYRTMRFDPQWKKLAEQTPAVPVLKPLPDEVLGAYIDSLEDVEEDF